MDTFKWNFATSGCILKHMFEGVNMNTVKAMNNCLALSSETDWRAG